MAGRIPDSFIQDLLARSDIVEVIGSRLQLQKSGREYKARSPFSNEKTPSFFISPAKQMYFDFSSGKNGNAIGFLMEFDRLEFVEAVEELARRAGLTVPRDGDHGPAQRVLTGPIDALAAAERFFREQLRLHAPAVDYLKRRGVTGETAKRFGIGYAPDSWDALARQFPVPEHAITAGLLSQREGADTRRGAYDRFRNRVMFPIRDTRGRTIGFGGRTLGNDPAKYYNSPETPLFHKGRNLFGLYEAKQSSKADLPWLLVVEGYMDVVMLAQHGLQNAVATLGTATTREHLHLLFKSTTRIVFCFDGDRAGRAAGWRALEQALPEVYENRECRFMFLPDGHDPDSLVQEIGAEAFRVLVDQATPLSDFLLAELARDANLASRDGRAAFVARMRPYLDQVRDPSLSRLLLDETARRARLSREDIAAIGVATAKPAAAGDAALSDSRQKRTDAAGARPVKRALQLLVEYPALALKVQHLEQLAEAPLPGIDLLVEAIEFFAENPGATSAQLHEEWRGTPKAAALARIAMPDFEQSAMGETLSSRVGERGLEAEFFDAMMDLRQKALRSRVQILLEKARETPLNETESAELKALNLQLTERRIV